MDDKPPEPELKVLSDSPAPTSPAPPDPPGEDPYTALENEKARHKLRLERSRLKFSYWLIVGALGAMIYLGLVDFFYEQDSNGGGGATLTPIIDTLKIVATTALGFALARRADNS